MEKIDYLQGSVERVVFQSADGFSVFKLNIGKKLEVIRGKVLGLQPGQELKLEGKWVFHPKFGRQFDASKCITCLPTSIDGIKKYLGSGLIKGIGKTYAERLVDKFGADVLDVIENDPQRLRKVSGIGAQRVEKIIDSWKDQKEVSNIMIFLQDKGISAAYAVKIFKKYGQSSIPLILENPYRLAEEVWGIGFKTADQIAEKLGIEKDSPKRVKAGILFAITNESGNGHLYVELDNLKTITTGLLELEEPEAKLKTALHALYNEDKIKLISQEQKHFVTLARLYFTEKSVSKKILNLTNRKPKLNFDLNSVYQELRTNQEIDLNEDQQKGILTALQNKITIITGGPGTGKTTLIKQLLKILDTKQAKYKLAAPTGRAAKRITEGSGKYALTIHRLLEFDPKIMGFAKNEKDCLQLDFLIIDEASMIDIFLANSILKALSLDAHLILIGDIDQLPSVGAGNFLNDLIKSKKIATIKLTQIFRQAKDSMIIQNAHRINNGEFPTTSLPNTKKDFYFIKENDPLKVMVHLKSIFFAHLKRARIPFEETVVLVPMNRGTVGTQKLNHELQMLLNPESRSSLNYMGFVYKVNDRVMQIKNNYDKSVFNGDMGTIEKIDHQEKNLFIRFYDKRLVEYNFNEMDELMLAYATSIHKSQGSEYSAVIIPIYTQHFTLLQRNLIYTAITRAKKLCIFIGQPKALAIAIKNNKSINRVTFLKQFLTTDLECR
jgi:exodeoxyribonuclease V alpha subunit